MATVKVKVWVLKLPFASVFVARLEFRAGSPWALLPARASALATVSPSVFESLPCSACARALNCASTLQLPIAQLWLLSQLQLQWRQLLLLQSQ